MAKYVACERDQIHGNVVWHTPADQQGQPIYASYAHRWSRPKTEAGPGDHFKRVTDASLPIDHPQRERFFVLEGELVYRWAAVTSERTIKALFDRKVQAEAYVRAWSHLGFIAWQVWGNQAIGSHVDIPQLI